MKLCSPADLAHPDGHERAVAMAAGSAHRLRRCPFPRREVIRTSSPLCVLGPRDENAGRREPNGPRRAPLASLVRADSWVPGFFEEAPTSETKRSRSPAPTWKAVCVGGAALHERRRHTGRATVTHPSLWRFPSASEPPKGEPRGVARSAETA